jgi:hypothetical protein
LRCFWDKMRSFYRFGFSAQPFSLGQGDNQTLSTAQGQKLYDDLDKANDKYGVVTDWKKNHPDLQKDLGNDYDNWQLVSQDDTKYGSAAQGLHDRLEKEVIIDRNPQISISPDDLTAANIWASAVDRLYVISANHTGKPVNSPAAPSGPASKASPGANASPADAQVPGQGSTVPIVIAVSGAALLGLLVFAGLSK